MLWALLERELTVERVAVEAGLEQSAASHQLRLLRDLRFVAARREGRHMIYRLADHHLPKLLAAVRHHREHATPGQRMLAAIERRTAST